MKLNHVLLGVAAMGVVATVYFVGKSAGAGRRRAQPALAHQEIQAPVSAVGSGAVTHAVDRAGGLKEVNSNPPSQPGQAPSEFAQKEGRALLVIALPQPQFTGTPKDTRTPNLEPDRNGKMRAPLVVPAGCDGVISRGCKVTSSDPEPIIGDLAFITDGDKEHDSGTYVEIGPGLQWVQVDLGQEREIVAACVWHYHGEARVYFDVISQLSNDATFSNRVVTVFNNDHDNSSKLGVGADKEYIETFEGRPFEVSAVKGRYVRFYSKGNSSNEMNHYTEVEVYGR